MGNTPSLTPQEKLKAHMKALDKAIREMDRERRGLERQQAKIQTDIRKAAKEGNMATVRIMAKDYVRSKNYVQKFYQMRTQLQGVKLRMRTMASTQSMADAMKGATKAMMGMARRMNMPQIQQITREFAMQSERMDMTQEMMEDAVDGVMEGSDDEEEEEGLVQQVMQELNLQVDLPEAPPAGQVAAGVAAPARTAAAIGSASGGGAAGGGGAGGGGGGGGAGAGGGGGGGGGLPSAPPPSGGGSGSSGGGGGGGGGGTSMSEMERRLQNLKQ